MTISRWVVTFLLFVVTSTYSQDKANQNLETCLSGQFPALCDHSALASEQAQQVRIAENRENLRVCMTGKYAALCDHSRLTADQSGQVKYAERIENLTVCLSGRYPALCNHGLLSLDDAVRVQSAEHSENLKTCLDGRYSAICNHSLLTSEQAKSVAAAEAKVAPSRSASQAVVGASHRRQSETCVSGLSIESVEGDGKVIKLDDGSMWEVDDVDTVDTALWLAADDVVLCGGKIINKDEDESADVTPIRRGVSGGGETIGSTPGDVVEASLNDETFIINGEVFKAKTYCFNFDKGDRVKFIEGSPSGACASATLLNLRSGKVCEVWCGE